MLPTVSQPALAVELIPPARVVTFRLAEAAGFEVPQVELPNPVATRRINRAIVQQLLVEPAELDSTGWEPGPALRRIWSACCRNENGQRQPTQGLTGTGYRVLRNDNRLLSFEYRLEFTGAYTYEALRHATFNTSTGQLMQLADIVADPRHQLQPRLRAAINRRIQATLTTALSEHADPDEMNNLADRFNWESGIRQVRFEDATKPATDDFAVSAKGVALFYSPWLPPALWPYAPDAAYLFPFGQLRLQPAWQHLKP